MYPFSLQSKEKVVALYELKADRKFQFIRTGNIGPVMIGYDYVLFNNEIADYLKTLDIEGLRFEKAVIWDRKSNIEYSEYQRAIISQHFSSDQINDINLDGLRFLIMDNRYLFSSPELTKFIASELPGIFDISEGLSQFA